MTDYKQLCAELLDWTRLLIEIPDPPVTRCADDLTDLLARTRAALAQPEPEGAAPQPVDGEVAELVTWLRERGQERETLHLPGAELSKQLRTAPFLLTRAADLLERVARRPKPPSLKEQALAVVENSAICDHLSPEHEAVLRRALEQLDD